MESPNPQIEVFWSDVGAEVSDIAVADGYLYLATMRGLGQIDQIFRCAVDGTGAVETIVTGEYWPSVLHVFEGSLLRYCGALRRIRRVLRPGAAGATLIVSARSVAFAFRGPGD